MTKQVPCLGWSANVAAVILGLMCIVYLEYTTCQYSTTVLLLLLLPVVLMFAFICRVNSCKRGQRKLDAIYSRTYRVDYENYGCILVDWETRRVLLYFDSYCCSTTDQVWTITIRTNTV